MYTIGIDGPGCSCDGEGCSLCTALDESCETCGVTLTDANRGDGIGDLCATCLATGVLDLVAEVPRGDGRDRGTAGPVSV